jgi:hypothetical protein
MRAPVKAMVAILSALLIGAALAAIAFAAGENGNFHSPARIISAGHAITIGGRISCTGGDAISVRATITQPATHSYAEGTWTGSCTGKAERWSTTAPVSGGAALESGCVEASALAITTSAGSTVAAEQWFERQLPADKPHQTVYCRRRL